MSNETNFTPLMKQYYEVKAKHKNAILLFRMGDFYETFNEDAKVTASVLGITLTKRGKKNLEEILLAGFPYHVLDTYLPKLLKAGLKVAICEQMENPKFAKGIVKRDVVEVLSSGINFSDKVLETKKNNFLCAIYLPSQILKSEDTIGISFIDVSTSDFFCNEISLHNLPDELQNYFPSEILIQKENFEIIKHYLKNNTNFNFTKLDEWVFSFDYTKELLTTQFQTKNLKGFGIENLKLGIISSGTILHYLNENQKGNISHIKKISAIETKNFVEIPTSTQRNLELIFPLNSNNENSTLISVLDKTSTPMGSRMLKMWIIKPLKNLEKINLRLNSIEFLSKENSLRKKNLNLLLQFGDLERLNSKICTRRANPKDVLNLKISLNLISEIKIQLQNTNFLLKKIFDNIKELNDLQNFLFNTIEENAPLNISDGNVIKSGFNVELDELKEISRSGKKWIANLQQKEREQTQINSLKIGFNNIFGYYIEVTNTHKNKVPQHYIKKLTMTNAERFVTEELKNYEEKILNAEEKILEIETKIFNDILTEISKFASEIQENAKLIATLDILISLTEVAISNNYVKPIVDESNIIDIKKGRHPVIEKLLPIGENYIPNDVFLDSKTQQLILITGPNMSGKSSFLRQVGLITLMSLCGSFVPAESAKISVVDKIFTRVGASDNIAQGESTFLVEMQEASLISNTATKKSLILLDEIGRGTSTFDGISIAWSISEFIHEKIGAKTLFATHYHELNELAQKFPRIKNFKVDVKEYGEKVIFLHKVTSGFADHSYGINVAKMAGLPNEIIERAKEILFNLEKSELIIHSDDKNCQTTLFEMVDDKLRDEIKKIDVDKLTPLEALKIIFELKKKISN